MKTTIYVFSGTGTSLAISKKISSTLKNTEIVSIPSILENMGENEIEVKSSKIGIVFPCYFGSIPNLVLEFIRKTSFERAKYIFAVVTSGGNTGNSLKLLAKELNAKGKKLDYGKSVSVSSNYIVAWYYRISCKKGKQLEKALQSFNNKSIQFAKDISCEKSDIDKSSYFLYKFSRFISSKKIVQDTRPWDREFNANEKCNGCSTCYKVCPVKNIKMSNHKPDFQHNCQRCMACIQYCPNNAIMYNGKSINRPKYFHPDFPAKKIIDFINSNSLLE